MNNNELLEIVDEQDKVIGIETRDNIHQQGLLHREIHIWVKNDKGEILFQRRSPTKDTYPNLLDASVGGHVEPGMTYEATAVKEMKEELGLSVNIKDIQFVRKTRTKGIDKSTGKTNNTFRKIFIYKLQSSDNLVLEKGKATALEFWSVRQLQNLTEDQKKSFIFTPLKNALEIFSKC